ncbi:hypothetical protein AAIR98_001433 [Elusimicrobium simillimum]|uniref:phage protein Gp13 family protein n=1 Tax=Elusimicrobium simillimum TaxID=3143438 RepID=UPI003C6F466C
MRIKKEKPTEEHLRFLAENLRKCDVKEILAGSGMDTLKSLQRSVAVSTESYVGTIGGQAILIYGVQKEKDCACVWLLATEEVEKHKISFIKQGKEIIKEFKEKYGMLYNLVYDENETTKRWLEYMGAAFANNAKPFGVKQEKFRFFIF